VNAALTLLDNLRDRKRHQIWSRDLATGRHGEDLVHRYLRRKGFTIVARNHRLAAGDAEADIIAREQLALLLARQSVDRARQPAGLTHRLD
jgi:hypothetical protein